MAFNKSITPRPIIFQSQAFTASLLTDDDLPTLQDLLEKASDYHLLISGKPPSSDDARQTLTELPPGKSLADKMVLGIFTADHSLTGVMDVVRDYPETGVWWIGLLLLDPARRSHGLGEAVYGSFEDWAAQSGAREIGLGVVEENVSAGRFWRRLGFVVLDKKPVTFGQKDQFVLRMRRKVTQTLTKKGASS